MPPRGSSRRTDSKVPPQHLLDPWLEGWGKRATYFVALATAGSIIASFIWQVPKFIWPATPAPVVQTPKVAPLSVELAAPAPVPAPALKQSDNLFCMAEGTAAEALVSLSRYYKDNATTIHPPVWRVCEPGWEADFYGSERAKGGGWSALFVTRGRAGFLVSIYAHLQNDPREKLKQWQRVRVRGTVYRFEPAEISTDGTIYLTEAEMASK
jgi:hypothetical protein